jgi:hypothetical protein
MRGIRPRWPWLGRSVKRNNHWHFVRSLVMDRADGICERCKIRPAQHVHHLTYERAGNEAIDDLEALCLICHGKEHPRHTFLPVPIQREIARQRRRGKLRRQIKHAQQALAGVEKRIEKRHRRKGGSLK